MSEEQAARPLEPARRRFRSVRLYRRIATVKAGQPGQACSYEIMQKCLATGGARAVCPFRPEQASDTPAGEFNLALVTSRRGDRFNLYSDRQRFDMVVGNAAATSL